MSARRFAPIIMMCMFITVYYVPAADSSISDFHLDYLLDVLRKFEKFSFIIHFDVCNAFTANRIAANISIDMEQYITSFNASQPNYKGLKRPGGINFVHLVLLENPLDFEAHLDIYGNVILYHTVIFIVKLGEIFDLKFWELKELKNAGNVIVMNMTLANFVIVYNKCYYCGEHAKQMKLIEVTSSTRSHLSKWDIYPSTFLKLHGHFLRIGHNEFFPYMYCRSHYDENSHCDDLAGSEWKLLEVLSAHLNFTYNTIGGNGDIFAHILNSSTDLVIGGVSLNYNRFILTTFSKFIRYEDLSFLYVCRISIWNYLKLYFAPFQYVVWITILAFLIVISLFIKTFVVRGNVHMDFWTSFLMCLRLLVEQTNVKISSKMLGHFWSPFILLVVLFMTCIVLGTSYKSILASILIRPPHMEPHSGEELVENGYEIVIDKGNKLKLFTELFSDKDQFLLIHVARHGKSITGLCNQIKYIIENSAAIIEEKSILQYTSLHKCIDYILPKQKVFDYNPDNFRITIEPIRSAPHAWALAPASPFWKAIDIIIGYLQNGGFLEKWTRDSLLEIESRKKIAYSKNNMIEDKQSDIVTYGCSFLLYSLGNIIASVVFVIEILISKYKRHRHAR